MESTTFFGYQVEIDRAATSAWYASAKEWGCECGDCRHYVALAKERRLPPDMMALLDSLGIPLEKATYVCSLYKQRRESSIRSVIVWRAISFPPLNMTKTLSGAASTKPIPMVRRTFLSPILTWSFILHCPMQKKINRKSR